MKPAVVLSCFSSPPPPPRRDSLPSSSPCVQWSVEYPPTSICLTSLSLSPTVAAPALQRLSQNLPWPLLCPHSSHLVRACPPWSHKAPSPRPSPLLTRLARPHTAVHPVNPAAAVRRPLLFVDRRASRLDHLTSPPPPATFTQPRLLYPPYHVQSISSVCLHQPKR